MFKSWRMYDYMMNKNMEYYIIYKQTYNNIFATIVDGVGRVILKRSGGQCGLQRSARNSMYAAGVLGSILGKLCRKRGIRNVNIKCRKRVRKKNFHFFRSFFSRGIKVGRKPDLRVASVHSSFRFKKLRRL